MFQYENGEVVHKMNMVKLDKYDKSLKLQKMLEFESKQRIWASSYIRGLT